MKSNIRQFLFDTSLSENKTLNAAWLLFRVHLGLSLALHAGLPKMQDGMAPDWFVQQVGEIGFTFISPAFWATVASWGEFIGGICLALGLFTRLSALQLAFQFFVISFIWYDTPEPLSGMYFQQTLFWGYVLAAFAGGGKYSIDKLIMNRKKTIVPTAGKVALISVLLFMTTILQAQKGPLKGSGKIVTKNFEYKNFDKVSLKDLDGKIEVTVGKPFSVSVAIDHNLANLLKAEVSNGELHIQLEGNNNNRMYIEETNIKVVITIPEISVLEHMGNSTLNVSGIVGRYFRLKNHGNGNARIEGTIDELDIICRDNGNVNARGITAKSVKINRSGNGNVYINTQNNFTANSSGNGNVVNEGGGRADTNSSATGNGEIKTSSDKKEENDYTKAKRAHVTIQNDSDKLIAITVKYPVKGSYGIDVKAGDSVKESFPVGTKLFRGNQFTAFKKPIYVVTADAGQTFIIKLE
jgi:uncharacterized membrane protein YphA (DoxX/SURF4 family)